MLLCVRSIPLLDSAALCSNILGDGQQQRFRPEFCFSRWTSWYDSHTRSSDLALARCTWILARLKSSYKWLSVRWHWMSIEVWSVRGGHNFSRPSEVFLSCVQLLLVLPQRWPLRISRPTDWPRLKDRAPIICPTLNNVSTTAYAHLLPVGYNVIMHEWNLGWSLCSVCKHFWNIKQAVAVWRTVIVCPSVSVTLAWSLRGHHLGYGLSHLCPEWSGRISRE